MNETLIESIKQNMEKQSTEDLLKTWKEAISENKSGETLEAIKRALQDRGERLPELPKVTSIYSGIIRVVGVIGILLAVVQVILPFFTPAPLLYGIIFAVITYIIANLFIKAGKNLRLGKQDAIYFLCMVAAIIINVATYTFKPEAPTIALALLGLVIVICVPPIVSAFRHLDRFHSDTIPKKRHFWIWVISIISLVISLFTFYESPSNFSAGRLTMLTFSFSILNALFYLSGGIALLLLRKLALFLFLGALILNILTTSWYILSEGTLASLSTTSFDRALLAVICIYLWKLSKADVLS